MEEKKETTFNGKDQKEPTIVFRDYKAGVVSPDNRVIIPFIYDDIQRRDELVNIPDEERQTKTTSSGKTIMVGSAYRNILHGFACYTNEGVCQAFDTEGNPCEFQDWEPDYFHLKQNWFIPENEHRTLQEIEELIQKDYALYLKMGESDEKSHLNLHIFEMILDRRRLMDKDWVHNRESAKLIARTNDLLMKAVKKAIKLGRKTAQSLDWMNHVSHATGYEVEVYVQPQWLNDKSERNYTPLLKSARAEKDRLNDQEDEVASTHIWNIIAAMGFGKIINDKSVCFLHWHGGTYDESEWDLKTLTLDDGLTWDEGIHYPCYQDVYFTHPFHLLYCDNFCYSYQDISNISDFCVGVNVKFTSRELK